MRLVWPPPVSPCRGRDAGPWDRASAVPDAATPRLTSLRVRMTDRLGVSSGFAAVLRQRLRTWLRSAVPRRPALPTGIRIDDLQGRTFFSTDDLCPSIDVPLAAGTYHVSVLQGARRRAYTVTLQEGITFELQLPWPS